MYAELVKGFLLAHHLGRLKDAGRVTPEQISRQAQQRPRSDRHLPHRADDPRRQRDLVGIPRDPARQQHFESVLTYEGTVEMHTLLIGKALTGQDAFRG